MNRNVRERILASARTLLAGGAYHLYFQALETRCRVSLVAPAAVARGCQEAVLDWVIGFESRYSRFVPGSLVYRLNAGAGRDWVETDPDLERLLTLCHESHSLTRGIFDPTTLPLIQLWNCKPVPTAIPDDAAIKDARRRVGWSKVRRAPGRVFLPEPGMCLDLGSIGREYAVDAVAAMVRRGGGGSVRVDFGQDLVAYGPAPDGRSAWRVELEDPRHSGYCWGGVGVRDLAVATSGGYLESLERGGRPGRQILDVRTGHPVSHGARSVSVLASSCTRAGVLANAAFVLGPAEGLRLLDALPGVAGCLLTDTLTLQTHNFHDYLAA